MKEAIELLRDSMGVVMELRRQIHQWCESNGGEADFDTSMVLPLLKRIDALLAQRTQESKAAPREEGEL